MGVNPHLLTCVLAGALSGLVKSILTNHGFKKPTCKGDVVHFGTAQDVLVASVLGAVVSLVWPLEEGNWSTALAVLVGYNPHVLRNAILRQIPGHK